MQIRPHIISVIVAMCLFMQSPAGAEPITGRTVRTWIEESKSPDQKGNSKHPYLTGKLQGYLTGLSEAMVLTQSYCPPEGLLLKDLLLLVDKHLEYDYANRDAPATPRLMQLLRQSYPCSPGIRKTPRPNPHPIPRPDKEQSA